ncbi:MAG: SiaB family protein kinase [Bacteroidota bacterium]
MSLVNVYNLFRSMEEENVILSFKGVVTEELLTSVLSIMETKMESMQESPKMRKKVFNVLVECLQNLYHHVDDKDFDEAEKRSALVMISKKNDQFAIRTGNYIDKDIADYLHERLTIINTMDKDELRKYYQDSLESNIVSTKGTAGLGMIDIARKSGNKLEFEFLKVDEKKSFFCFDVKID